MSVTLYRLCSAEQADQDIADDAVVEVTSVRLESDGKQVLYELHPLPSLIEDTEDQDVFKVRWKDALNWPHQITSP